jgi:hypothetical protein
MSCVQTESKSLKILKISVFWVVAPCSLVEVYQRFRGPCCLPSSGRSRCYNPEDSSLHTHRRENLKSCFSEFWYRWSEAAHHWGCGCSYLWHAATSVGRAGLSIWHLPRHTWGSHRVLVRCGNNFESSSFSLYIAHRHMFNITCKINSWKCILLSE